MVVTDEQLEAMCEAHFECALSEDMWSWSKLPEYKRRARRRRMRAALAVLPQPASAAMPNEGRIADAIRVHIACDSSDAHAAAKAISLLARRPATDEAEALRAAVDRNTRQAMRIADLEAQLACVTEERDLSVFDKEAARRERDEALAKLADATSEFETRKDGRVVRKDRWEHAFRAVVSRFTSAREEFEVAPTMWRAIELVEKGLAARPEPVVIDEALAERVFDAYYRAPNVSGRTAMLVALRSVFGDRASVSVPVDFTVVQGPDGPMQFTAAEWRDMYTEAAGERDQLLAELEKTRAELAETHKTWQRINDRHVDEKHALREQLDALRAACTPTEKEAEARGHVKPDRLGASDWTVRQLAGFYDRVQAALLKPAPAQYHPNDLDDVDGDVSQLDEPGRQAPAEAEPVKPKGDEHAKRQVRRTVEEEGPADAGEAAQREGGHGPCRGKERRLPTTDGGGILGAGVTRWEDQPSATNDVGELQEEFRARLFQRPPPESAMVEPVRCDFGDECPGHASPDDRPCGWEPASPADALRPNDRHGMVGATATEQVLRHASEPDCEPIADWVAKRGLPGVPASLQPLIERVERLEQLAALAIRKADTALEALLAREGVDRG